MSLPPGSKSCQKRKSCHCFCKTQALWGSRALGQVAGECECADAQTHPHIATSKLVLPSLYPLDDYRVEDTRFSESVSKVLHIHGQGNLFTNAEWISHFSRRHQQKKENTSPALHPGEPGIRTDRLNTLQWKWTCAYIGNIFPSLWHYSKLHSLMDSLWCWREGKQERVAEF